MMITDSMLTNFKAGDRVKFGQFDATISRVCTGQLKGLYEIRLDRGVSCVCGSDLRVA